MIGGYAKRLEADLSRWVDQDLVSEASAKTMLADARTRHESSTPILPILAGLAVTLGILTVIAANWSVLSGVARLAIFTVLFALALLSAGELRHRRMELASNIAAAIGAALFGGGLVVVGQLYHVGASVSAFFSVWTLGALGVAFALRSPLAAALTAGIAVAWIFAHESESSPLSALAWPPFWAFGVLIALGAACWLWRTLGLVHIAAIAAIIWLSLFVGKVFDLSFSNDSVAVLAVFWAFAAAGLETLVRLKDIWAVRTLSGWATWMAVWAFVAYLISERFGVYGDTSIAATISLSVFGFGVFAALTAYGSAPGRRWLRGAGVAGFIGTAVVVFTLADNLLAAGVTMIVVGAALIALIVVTNRMLKSAQSAEASA